MMIIRIKNSPKVNRLAPLQIVEFSYITNILYGYKQVTLAKEQVFLYAFRYITSDSIKTYTISQVRQ